MRLYHLFIVLGLTFSAIQAQASPDAFEVVPQIEIGIHTAEIILENPKAETPIFCTGEIVGDTYFDDNPYLPIENTILFGGDQIRLILSSRYGDPFEDVYTVIFCQPYSESEEF